MDILVNESANYTITYNGTAEREWDNCTVPTGLPDTIHPAVDYVQATVVLFTAILGISMNGFVVFLVCRFRALHKMAFFLALQLIVTHLVFSSTVLPVMFATALVREWRLGTVMCQILGSIHDLAITIRYLLTFVLTTDRVISVFRPFFYLRHGGKAAIFNSVVAWIISIIRSMTSLKGVLSCTQYVPAFKMCSSADFCSDICQAHALLFSTLLALFGVIIPFALYVTLFCKAMMIKYHLRHSLPSVENNHDQIVPFSVLLTKSSGTDQPWSRKGANNSQEILSAANPVENRTRPDDVQHNYRATITFVILTAVIMGCALPPYILYATQFALAGNSSPILIVLQIIVGRTLIYSLVAADPIVIMRNRDVREVLNSIAWCAR